jgi:hypothetical protein
MRKTLPLIIIFSIVLTGLEAAATVEPIPLYKNLQYLEENLSISEPLFHETEKGEVMIDLKEMTTTLTQTGNPLLPVILKKYQFPLGTRIHDVDVSVEGKKTYSLTNNIALTPAPVTQRYTSVLWGSSEKKYQLEDTYDEVYPPAAYSSTCHVGLDGKEHVIIVHLRCYPVQYIPTKHEVTVAQNIGIKIAYESPQSPRESPEVYDLVIITPKKFLLELQPLVTHKNEQEMKTTLKTTESIYEEYQGRDQPEQIKYFIKDALEQWDIHYVLLVGGKKSLLFGNWGIEGPRMPNDDLWYVPVRYSNLVDSTGEKGFLTDLYFADIYKYEETEPVFDDWDSNGNGIFAEWSLFSKDTLDLMPDVCVGRLACRNKLEVRIMVNKIITYEQEGCDPEWFNRIVGVGGDSFDDRPPLGDDWYEGEERTKLAFDYVSNCEPVKIWASNQDTGGLVPSPGDIVKTINDGCGFVYFAGHGNPFLYNTHWVHEYSWNNTPGGLRIYQMPLLRNKEKLPICVVGACHNSEFNVSFFDYLNNPLTPLPTPECWSWWLTRKIGGGAIATIGYTGLEWVALYGWDSDDIPDCTQYYSGYIDSRFFYAYGVDGIDILGEAWGQAVNDYLDRFPGMEESWDCKTAQQWLLLGDPSLKIGGYT